MKFKKILFYIGVPYLALHMPIWKRARVFVVADTHFLAARSQYGSNNWFTPGGGIKKKETSDLAARRELFEETGIKAKLEDFHFLGSFRGRFAGIVFSRYDTYYLLLERPIPTRHVSHEKIETQWKKLQSIKDHPEMYGIDVRQAFTAFLAEQKKH